MTDEPTPAIATPQEVLEAFTAMLRGERTTDQLKAAEYLAKHYGILAPKEQAPAMNPAVIGEIEAALREMEVKGDG